MRTFALPMTLLAGMFVVSMHPSPAQAQLAHTWVASNGSDGANCDRPTPCATFTGAYNKTNAKGEITCVDSGNYQGLSFPAINKSITINCEAAIGSSTTTGGLAGDNFVINTAATDVVTFRGLDIDALGSVGGGGGGMIKFVGAGVLHVEKVRITNVGGSFNGIRFAPTGPSRLDVADSFIAHTGTDIASAGISIRPTGSGSANVSIDRVRLQGNVNGIFLDGSGGGGAVNLNVRDSVVTGSSNVGIVVASSGQGYSVVVDRTTVNSSFNVGVAVSGAAATVRINDSTISGNVTGVGAFGGGNLRSYKNNRINGNGTDGTPIAAVDALN